MSLWDERYASEGYVYGTAPNAWLLAQAHRLRPGSRVLCLGEGEGRNAVWLARQGHAVEAVDGSPVGLEKARRLAGEAGVSITTTVADLAEHRPARGGWDAVVLVFVHLPPALRPLVHARAADALAPGGLLVVEGLSPAQLGLASGGPRQPDWLFTPEVLRTDFPGVRWEILEERRAVLDEGPLHQGPAALVSGLGRKAG